MSNKNKKEIKELNILNNAIKKIEKIKGKKLVESEDIKNIMNIVEEFIKKKKLICYGGTAINNILPIKEQFYNKKIELPDYDFFSKNALDDAKELADIFYNNNYNDVEAKAGIHSGTFKVFVNFKAVADITDLDSSIFNNLLKNTIKIDNINYAPPNYLRMSMYLELSRPDGDISRWEKVLQRLILLNKNYPLKGIKCNSINFEREFEGPEDKKQIYNLIKDIAIKLDLVFFGGYSLSLYSKYYKNVKLDNNPDFDLLSINASKSSKIFKHELDKYFSNVKIKYHKPIGELISDHYEILIGNDTVAIIYKTNSCYSYNNYKLNNKIYKIATIDTLLSFYLAFYYSNRKYFDKNRILCVSEFLFNVQQKNRLSQRGILKRFVINCYGKHKSIEEIRKEKQKKYILLYNKKNSRKYEYNFLKYNPNLSKLEKIYNKRTIKKKINK